ncbi:unnamed protein product [Symbiodinium natans]|uniref:Uncharacterized protein n=1 Tax=Symbiodinium natans TaxID=878477 RepID=A0A812TUN9_9DINO|nr:unnamed protein product [Symbiodinium natans]
MYGKAMVPVILLLNAVALSLANSHAPPACKDGSCPQQVGHILLQQRSSIAQSVGVVYTVYTFDYQGCYMNEVAARANGHVVGITMDSCADLAVSKGHNHTWSTRKNLRARLRSA